MAVLKYNGGGDWYSNPTALKNLIQYCNTNISTKITSKPETVETNSIEIFNYPIVFMTGHGNVFFGENDIENLKKYLSSGGFLHISDNYGMDTYIRREMKKVFPELGFQEIPYNHPIYHQTYNFERLPKIHEHDAKRSKRIRQRWINRKLRRRIHQRQQRHVCMYRAQDTCTRRVNPPIASKMRTRCYITKKNLQKRVQLGYLLI